MKWISVLVFIGSCLTCGMLGLTAGINLNPTSTVSYVWDWNAAGSWVSGFGALLAVCVALWQSHRQQEKEKARCRILLSQGQWYFKTQIVSEGIVPATVLSASIFYDGSNRSFELNEFANLGATFPHKIERGEVMTLIDVSRDDFRRLGFRLSDSLTRDLAERGIKSNAYDKESSEAFFAEIHLCGERDAELLLRTAHADIRHRLPPELMRNLFSLVEEGLRKDWLNQRDFIRREFELIAGDYTNPLPD